MKMDRKALCALTLVLLCAPALAQDAPASSATGKPADDASSGTMARVVVKDTAGDTSVLPTATPSNSVYGTDMSVLDTPRTVTAVSSKLMTDANIQSLGDFVRVAPSTYTTDQFGVASVPNIRGQKAAVFIDGMARIDRGDGPPTSFNPYESVDIVAGPASAVYGPTANTGGYVNLITKQPYFDAFHSTSSFTYGSYDTKRWTEDIGAPIIKDTLAFRASYEGDYSGSYYNNVFTNTNDVFLALAWTPTKDFDVSFNSEFYDGRYNEVTGWNRPTQDLISNHEYTTGAVTGGFFGPPAAGMGGVFRGAINPTGTVRIGGNQILVSPSDSDFAKDLNAEITTTYRANDDLSFVNKTYYEYSEMRNSEYAQLYVNAQTINSIDDRFEIHYDFDTPISDGTKTTSKDKDGKDLVKVTDPTVFKNSIVTGAEVKYLYGVGFGDFLSGEFLNSTDLSTGTFPNVGNQIPNAGISVFPTPYGWFASPGSSQPNSTTESAYETSLFYQHQIAFTPQWSLLVGGRMDVIYDDLSDSVWSNPGVDKAHDTTTQMLGTGDVSLTYKPKDWMTLYTTFDFNESTAGTGFGGFDTYSNGGQSADYHYKNYLYEGGVKFDLLDHKLYTSVDGFYQTHNTSTVLGDTSEIRTLGAEISTTYQPTKNFYLTLNESYLHAIVVNPGAEFTQNVYDAFDPTVGSPNFTPLAPGHYREGGLPQFLFSGMATYKFDFGLSTTLGYTATSPIPTNELGNVWIPWQYELNATVAYDITKNLNASITFFNFTDQANFSTGGFISGTGGDLITLREPFHMEGTVSYKF